jgi:NitT/TauT family transport system permease protein
MKPLLQSETFVRIAAPLAVGVVLLAVWEIGCRLGSIPVYLFPKPSDIFASLIKNGPSLLRALLITLRITLQAFAAAVVLGTLIAFMFVQSRAIEVSLFPYAVLLQVTPLVALFPIISNTTLGLRSVDPGLASYFRMNRASRLKTLVRLRIPGALPYFFGGLRISSGLALIGAVVAEFVAGTGGRSSGLAYEILDAGFQLDIPRMFAALFLITVTGVLLFGAMVGLSKLALSNWHESEIGAEA